MDVATCNELLDAALAYAARGLAVLPCEPRGKEPLTRRGVYDASTDEGQIRGWWHEYPEANIGIACGTASGLICLDLDVKPDKGLDGRDALHDLMEENGALPICPTAATGGGGIHYILQYPPTLSGMVSRKLKGCIDVLCNGRYFLAAPSVHPSGKRYQWVEGYGLDDVPLAPAPDWLLRLITAKLPPPPAAKRSSGKVGEILATVDGKERGERSEADYAAVASLVELGLNDAAISATVAGHSKFAERGQEYIDRTIAAARAKTGPKPTDTVPDVGPSWYSIEEIGQRPEYREGVQPITTGFTTLDQTFRGGFRPESVYIIAGRTGHAKSTLALNIARRTALSGNHVLFFKLEESVLEATWKLHACASQVDILKLLDGARLATDERDALVDGWELIRDLPIVFSDKRGMTDIERIGESHKGGGGQLIMIDQLSMIGFPAPGLGAYERATEISAHLRRLACYLRVPIVLVCQVNRPAAKSSERLTCNDLRDSGCLENDASGIILIDRVRKADCLRWRTEPLALELLIGKNRYGQPTRDDDDPLELSWWPHCCRIEDPATPRLAGVRE